MPSSLSLFSSARSGSPLPPPSSARTRSPLPPPASVLPPPASAASRNRSRSTLPSPSSARSRSPLPPPASVRNGRPRKKMPANLLRDIRDAASFLALTELYLMKGMTRKEQEVEMEVLFWGAADRDLVSTLQKLINGSEVFANMYDKSITGNGIDLVIKEHCHGTGDYFVSGRHFDAPLLSLNAFTQPQNGNIIGSTIINGGAKVLKNCKKALSLMKKLDGKILKLNERNEVVDYFSGIKEVDMLRHINDGMYMMQERENNEKRSLPVHGEVANGEVVSAIGENDPSTSGGQVNEPSLSSEAADGQVAGAVGVSAEGENEGSGVDEQAVDRDQAVVSEGDDIFREDEDDDELMASVNSDTSEDRIPDSNWIPFGGHAPLSWRFHGYTAFTCFGPHTSYLSLLLTTSGNSDEKKKSKSGGRNAFREDQAKRARIGREHGTERGMNIQTKVQLASVAQNEDGADMRDKESRLATLAALIQSKAAMSDRKLRQSEMTRNQERKDSLLEESIKIDEEIKHLEDELNELTQEKRKRNVLVQNIMEQAVQMMNTSTEDRQQASTTVNALAADVDWKTYDRVHGSAHPNNQV